jgi:hypothetical protein
MSLFSIKSSYEEPEYTIMMTKIMGNKDQLSYAIYFISKIMTPVKSNCTVMKKEFFVVVST